MVGSAENPEPWDPNEPLEFKWHPEDHGKPSTYNAGCRCASCRAANTEKLREYRKSKSGQKYSAKQLAMQRASSRLRRKHPDEFRRLYAEELERIYESTGR